MREIGRARRGACGWHAVHVAAEVGGRRAVVMVFACGIGDVVVRFILLDDFDLRGGDGGLRHRHHAGLEGRDDKKGNGEQGAEERTSHSPMSARILHAVTSATA